MPSFKLYLKAKTSCFGFFWREPEEREQILELVDEIETWKCLLKDVDLPSCFTIAIPIYPTF